MQSRAGDQWNEYQAKKIRMDNLSVDMDLLALQPSNDTAAVAAKTKEYQAHIEKWKVDLAEEQEKAREFEREVTLAEAEAARYDLGEALLQIAVVLCSITLFTRNRAYFLLGLALGTAGIVVAFSALLVSRQPALDKSGAETTRLLQYYAAPDKPRSGQWQIEVQD
jgi:hypothetical protein